MLKTYRIIPLVFILFLFGFTLITVAPVFAQSWEPSMGMRHPDRPCMKVNSCGRDNRSSADIASDPYDTNNPAIAVAARANTGEGAQFECETTADTEAENAAKETKMVRQRDDRIRHLTRSLRDTMSREEFRSQLSVIQHYAPIEGEANIIACPKCS